MEACMCISEKSKIFRHKLQHVFFINFSKHKINAGIQSISANDFKQNISCAQ